MSKDKIIALINLIILISGLIITNIYENWTIRYIFLIYCSCIGIQILIKEWKKIRDEEEK